MKTESMFKVRREDLHNFTREENDALTRVGPATLMGNLMRQYWIPVVPTAHLKEPGKNRSAFAQQRRSCEEH